jgi:hypothetical protein
LSLKKENEAFSAATLEHQSTLKHKHNGRNGRDFLILGQMI